MKSGVRLGLCAGVALAWGCVDSAMGQTNAAAAAKVDEIVVRKQVLQEEQPVGPYAQPEWTTHRRFPMTRVYLQNDPYEMGCEQWWRLRHFRDGTTEQRFQEEVSLGLPGRIQLDLYETWKVFNSGDAGQGEASVERRYALAVWGRLPGNPTIYLEWVFAHDAADGLEAKLLLGDELAAGMHRGVNFICEQQFGDERTTEYAVSAALGKTLVDQKFGLGLEAKYASESEQDARSEATQEVLLGPSLQWRPAPEWHIDLAPLAGLTDDSPRLEAWAVVGFEFGGGAAQKSVQAPISTLRN